MSRLRLEKYRLRSHSFGVPCDRVARWSGSFAARCAVGRLAVRKVVPLSQVANKYLNSLVWNA